MAYRIGIDIGGTFTDFALLDDVHGHRFVHKRLTTPDDPSRSVLEGIADLLAEQRVPIGELTQIVHATTLVTNAVIERRGAVTGLLATDGFTDIPDIAKETRYDLFDLRLQFPRPLVPRSLRRGVTERIGYDGAVHTELDLASALTKVSELVDVHGIEALAICLLHSYARPDHELRLREAIARDFPKLFVSLSSEVSPFIREFERWTTTMANAYVQPIIDQYLSRLVEGLEDKGFRGTFLIMASNGGTMNTDLARRLPVRLLESGPAAGVLMATHHGRVLGIDEELSFDMGGTTAKGALIANGKPLKRFDLEVARVHHFKRGSGLPIRIPVIDLIEIGSGGGGIVELDRRGVIRVGPRSAGADPGPVCYGRGGKEPTLTDANLVLGYYDPQFFLGGRMPLDRDAAEDAILKRLAVPLSVDSMAAAWGVHETINEDVARAFRTHAAERGFDYSRCAMIAFGGSGPAHAMRIARKLKIGRVVFPIAAGVMSALGLLVSPISYESARTRRMRVTALTPAAFADAFDPLVGESRGFLVAAGVPGDAITVSLRLDMRYVGQGYEIEVAIPGGRPEELVPRLPELFHAAYAEVFSRSFPDDAIEIVNWKVLASGPEPGLRETNREPGDGASAVKLHRRAYFPRAGGLISCPVYDRYALQPGATVIGPALVEERETTIVLDVGDIAQLDARRNLVATLE
jgi:N-methylhydantoinase A